LGGSGLACKLNEKGNHKEQIPVFVKRKRK